MASFSFSAVGAGGGTGSLGGSALTPGAAPLPLPEPFWEGVAWVSAWQDPSPDFKL